MPRRRASVGMNQKTSENPQRRQRRFPSALSDGTTLLRFSIFSESGPARMNFRSGGLKHRLGFLRRGGFFGSFLAPVPTRIATSGDKQKK